MYDVLFKIFDSTKSLLKDQKINRKGLFNSIIEPAMRDMEILHNGYYEYIGNCMEVIENKERPLDFLTDYYNPEFKKLYIKAIKFNPLTEKVYSHTDTNNIPEFSEFIKSIQDYFKEIYYEPSRNVTLKIENITSSIIFELLNEEQFLASLRVNEKDKIKKIFDLMIETLNKRFRKILDLYFQLKIDCFK